MRFVRNQESGTDVSARDASARCRPPSQTRVLDSTRGLSGVAVFDAQHVNDGPVALESLDYPLPLGFHGQFTTA